ncbi:hypothetical protein T4B_8776 [Trichinella pseudospiralis]|uniref:Uncharacterized protein n=1 Tax=Trichinella pseudospiralis TaxID=6337 RepID=A0A0V1IWZ1_TRIPS|nr:hypothetical protein T4B_8776 [Trichinella pseudospiralis]
MACWFYVLYDNLLLFTPFPYLFLSFHRYRENAWRKSLLIDSAEIAFLPPVGLWKQRLDHFSSVQTAANFSGTSVSVLSQLLLTMNQLADSSSWNACSLVVLLKNQKQKSIFKYFLFHSSLRLITCEMIVANQLKALERVVAVVEYLQMTTKCENLQRKHFETQYSSCVCLKQILCDLWKINHHHNKKQQQLMLLNRNW